MVDQPDLRVRCPSCGVRATLYITAQQDMESAMKRINEWIVARHPHPMIIEEHL